jgi:hypothetical protein
MKKLLASTLFLGLLSLTSCAHHGCNGQCKMDKEKCEKCCEKSGEQCPMKHEDKKAETKTEEVKK